MIKFKNQSGILVPKVTKLPGRKNKQWVFEKTLVTKMSQYLPNGKQFLLVITMCELSQTNWKTRRLVRSTWSATKVIKIVVYAQTPPNPPTPPYLYPHIPHAPTYPPTPVIDGYAGIGTLTLSPVLGCQPSKVSLKETTSL